MKLYRIQANYKNVFLDHTVEAADDKAALESFSASYDSGQLTEKEGPGFNIGETSIGVQVGVTGVRTG